MITFGFTPYRFNFSDAVRKFLLPLVINKKVSIERGKEIRDSLELEVKKLGSQDDVFHALSRMEANFKELKGCLGNYKHDEFMALRDLLLGWEERFLKEGEVDKTKEIHRAIEDLENGDKKLCLKLLSNFVS